MSKLDPTSESLESILASIRRSLSEQSTDILADDGVPTPVALDTLGAVVPGEDAPPRFLGNGGLQGPRQPESPLPAEAPLPTGRPAPTDQAFAGLDDPPPPASISATLARLTEESPPTAPMAVPASVATSPQAEEAPKEPLWFLGRGKDRRDAIPAPMPSGSPQPAAAQPPPVQMLSPATTVPPPAATPKPVLKEIVRGPLPPFFGSSPEAAKVELAPTPPMPGPLPGAAIIPPAPMPPAPEPPRGAAPDSTPRAVAVPATREGLPNGKAHSLAVPLAAESTSSQTANPPTANAQAGHPAQPQGLDAMVADLLRPMLRRWLDENMPRLVSAALKAEAENVSKRDPKKP
jgi:uncharacterized protein